MKKLVVFYSSLIIANALGIGSAILEELGKPQPLMKITAIVWIIWGIASMWLYNEE